MGKMIFLLSRTFVTTQNYLDKPKHWLLAFVRCWRCFSLSFVWVLKSVYYLFRFHLACMVRRSLPCTGHCAASSSSYLFWIDRRDCIWEALCPKKSFPE